MIDRNFIGNPAAFIASVLFGASVVATRMIVGSIPPLSLAFLRFGQGGLILLISLLIFRPDLLRVKLSDLPYLTLLGAVLFTIFPVTFNVGLKYTEASRGALMLATVPGWLASQRVNTSSCARLGESSSHLAEWPLSFPNGG